MTEKTQYFVARLSPMIAARRLEATERVSGGHCGPDETFHAGDYEAGGEYYRAADFERLYEPLEDWVERKKQ